MSDSIKPAVPKWSPELEAYRQRTMSSVSHSNAQLVLGRVLYEISQGVDTFEQLVVNISATNRNIGDVAPLVKEALKTIRKNVGV